MNDDAFEYNLLARYLADECSAAEAEIVHRWMDCDPQRRDEMEWLDGVWRVAADLPSPAALTRMWSTIAREIDSSAGPLTMQNNLAGRSKAAPFTALSASRASYRRVVSIAAACVLLAGSITAVWWVRSEGRGASVVSADAGMREFHTPRGQQSTMVLLDGTRVALGPESRLQVRIGDVGTRELVLEGEATFEVTHNAARPFVVRAGTVVTEDLGTAFGVRAYADEPIRVVVREGAVAVRDTMSNRALILAPRQLAEVSRGGTWRMERGIDPQDYLGWTTGRLVFRAMPLAGVVAELERWFDIRMIVADSALVEAKVSASFDNADLDEVLSTLTSALDARAERRGRWVYLRDRR